MSPEKVTVKDLLSGKCKKPVPILSYPAAQFVSDDIEALSKSSELQARVVKSAADRCPGGAAVTLMDLSVEAECFGAEIIFSKSAVPAVKEALIKTAADAEKLEIPAVGSARSGIFIDTVKKAKQLITDRPLLAGAAAPFSLAARLIDVTEIMFMCFDEPEAVHTVLKKCTEFLIGYVKALKEAGADGIILAEPVAGLLSPELEEEFSAPYTKQLVNAVKDDGFAVIYHNCGQSVSRMTDSVFSNGCDAYHFGNAVDLKEMLAAAPADKLIMGNLDPVALFKDGTPGEMKKAVKDLLCECAGYDNFLLSSGCDIPANAKWENIDAFFAAAKEFYEG